jgi:predicted DNA-binding protein YlxM (UPF0122 family)
MSPLFKAARLRLKKKLEYHLDFEVYFRDYDIKNISEFGKINKVAVHQQVDRRTIESDVQNALYNFRRDGFGSIVFYI